MANILAEGIVSVRICINLILSPYQTMRELSVHHSKGRAAIIFWTIVYFILVEVVRGGGSYGFIICIVDFFLTTTFFAFLPGKDTVKVRYSLYLRTWVHTLYPTLFWFYSNLILYLVLPPPRTFSLYGIGFSVFYIAYSLSLLLWKIMLVYLSIRFSSRIQLYRIMYYFLLYLVVFCPLWIVLYYLGFSRIPFV